MDNLNVRLSEVCRRLPEKVALADAQSSLTFGQLWRLSAATAGFLGSATPGEAIGVMLPPVKEFGPVFFGSLLAGKTVVPLNFLLAPPELGAVIRDAGLRCIITSRVLAQRLGNPDLPFLYVEDFAGALVSAAGADPPAKLLDAAFALPDRHPAAVIYTAGTSGDPKGVVLSHGNLLANTDSCVRALALNEKHTLLASLPFFHAFGLSTGLVMPVCFGGTTVLLPRFSPQGLVDMVARHRVNIILTVPAMWTVLVKSGQLCPKKLDSLQICISGGEPLPAMTYDAFERVMGFPLLEGYGLTECSPVVSLTPPPPPAPRKGSVGLPLPGVEVRVVGPNREALSPGQEGQIEVRGGNVMTGYFKRPDLTAECFTDDGWFSTGDRGALDQSGLLYVTGRQKDLIITGGENVAPREVEEVLIACPGVEEAAVVGVPEGSRGEVVKAFVVRSPGANLTETDLRSFCRKNLASYKVPRIIDFLEQLPRNFAGKVLKRNLPS